MMLLEACCMRCADHNVAANTVVIAMRTQTPGMAIDAVRDEQGNTPLMLAAAHGHGRLVKLCMRKVMWQCCSTPQHVTARQGASPAARNAHGITATELAKQGGHRSIHKHLTEAVQSPS